MNMKHSWISLLAMIGHVFDPGEKEGECPFFECGGADECEKTERQQCDQAAKRGRISDNGRR